MRAIDGFSIAGALTFVVIAGATGFSIAAPAAGLSLAMARVLPLSAPHAAVAQAALNRSAFAQAASETNAELAVSPIRDDAWLRLAKIDLAEHNDITDVGAGALGHAYDARPYDLDPQSSRVSFVLDHYSALPASVKYSALDELGVWARSPALRTWLHIKAAQTKDPSTRTMVFRLPDA